MKVRGATIWLEVAENARPVNRATGMPITTGVELVDLYGPLLHAVAIDKISRGEEKVRGRYSVTAEAF